ncbi:MAG: pentapeptide repeat-containing protein [Alphaproteobacteria bacterium]|nr:MAG: pentapeptide repeat-containing protein [Alphaproteobacteria bacterium]
MDGADLSNANLRGANVSTVSLAGAQLIGAKIDCKTQLPRGLNIKYSQIIWAEPSCDGHPQSRDFSNTDWVEVDLSGLNLDGAKFSNSKLELVDFRRSSLQGADFSNVTGKKPWQAAVFSQADLTNASFTNANFHPYFGSNARSPVPSLAEEKTGPAVLHNTDFTGATLSTSAFFTRYQGQANLPDLQTAKFDNLTLICAYSSLADTTHELNQIQRLKSDETGFYKTRFMKDHIIKNYEEDLRHASETVATERNLFMFFKNNWPDTKFDKSCAQYLSDQH